VSGEVRVRIAHDSDIVMARQRGREIAVSAGFSGADLTLIATAISEVARNMLTYAGSGEIILALADERPKRGIVIVAKDKGPGIADLDRAMQDGFSTGNSLGDGLPGAKRLMNEFHIESRVGKGTTITMKKWVR
jgi:serine/threonine-protein kinase RsbT